MYLVGTFQRDYFSFTTNENPLSLVFVKEEITKDDLMKASKDEDYQVINFIKREYYDPKQNKWVSITKL